jgi:hypothetical protein
MKQSNEQNIINYTNNKKQLPNNVATNEAVGALPVIRHLISIEQYTELKNQRKSMQLKNKLTPKTKQ